MKIMAAGFVRDTNVVEPKEVIINMTDCPGSAVHLSFWGSLLAT
jgi:hypothetical protein